MENFDIKLLGERIKAARTVRNLTLDTLSEQINIHKSTISRYEQGKIERPKLPVVHAIASALLVNPSWLIGATDNMSPVGLTAQPSGYWDGSKLTQERTERGYSIKKTAYLLGLSEDEYISLEKGTTEPTFTTLMRMSTILHLDVDYICTHLFKCASSSADSSLALPSELKYIWLELNTEGRKELIKHGNILISTTQFTTQTTEDLNKKEA